MVFMALSASEHTYHELAAAAAESESAEAIPQVITTIQEDDRDQKWSSKINLTSLCEAKKAMLKKLKEERGIKDSLIKPKLFAFSLS